MTRVKQLTMAALLAAPAMMATHAQADGARDWLNAPVNMNFLYLYYTYSNSETSINSPLPVDGAEVSASVPILRYARTFDLGGRTAGGQLVVPYAFIDAKLTGTRVDRSIDGMGDITAIFLANLYGAPALSAQEFATWRAEGDFVTAALSVTMPTGSYKSDRLINPGKNRWAFKPQVAWGRPLGDGKWLTANAAVEFYQDNDDYLGGGTLEQDPLVTLDAHYSVNLNKAAWISGDAIWTTGGETSVNGVDKDNRQNTLRLGLSGSMNFSPTDAVSAGFTTTVAKKDYTADATTFQISYSKIW